MSAFGLVISRNQHLESEKMKIERRHWEWAIAGGVGLVVGFAIGFTSWEWRIRGAQVRGMEMMQEAMGKASQKQDARTSEEKSKDEREYEEFQSDFKAKQELNRRQSEERDRQERRERMEEINKQRKKAGLPEVNIYDDETSSP